MATARKVFASKTANASPPIDFDLTLENAEGQVKTIELQAYGAAPGPALLLVGRMGRITPDGRETVDLSGLDEFFSAALLPDSVTKWREMLADKVWMVDGEVLGDIFVWLQEQWTDRPTVPSSTSSGSQSLGGVGSTANASSPA